MKHIRIIHWNEMINTDDIFDPSKILYLKINGAYHPEVLRVFNNLRSLDVSYTFAKDLLTSLKKLK